MLIYINESIISDLMKFMPRIELKIEIDSSRMRIYDIIRDISNMSKWNTVIHEVIGVMDNTGALVGDITYKSTI